MEVALIVLALVVVTALAFDFTNGFHDTGNAMATSRKTMGVITLAKDLLEISSPQGMAAESSSAAVILTSSRLGFALPTTHVASGSILGTGLGKRGAEVRWGVALRMIVAWLITLPSAAVVGATMFWIGHALGTLAGSIVISLVLCGLSASMYWHSTKKPVDAHNVNADWNDAPVNAEPVPVAVSATQA